jgi:3-deoxy-manno-octulosonate cytidylyltransferase (CMP-KDO synthetase)
MVQWVYENARRSGAAEVLVATDDERIATAVRSFGGAVAMTGTGHASGTDRIAEVARAHRWGAGDIVVNVQGDEPLLPPALLDQAATLLLRHPQADMATLAMPVGSLEAFMDPNVVKVVADRQQRALYFSRAPIPWCRDGAKAGPGPHAYQGARRHIGLYAYRLSALLRMASLPPTSLEELEKLEQLRALEHGMDIRVSDAEVAPGPDVNTPEDVERVAALLQAQRR